MDIVSLIVTNFLTLPNETYLYLVLITTELSSFLALTRKY